MGNMSFYIPKKHKEAEDKLRAMGTKRSRFILECILRELGKSKCIKST